MYLTKFFGISISILLTNFFSQAQSTAPYHAGRCFNKLREVMIENGSFYHIGTNHFAVRSANGAVRFFNTDENRVNTLTPDGTCQGINRPLDRRQIARQLMRDLIHSASHEVAARIFPTCSGIGGDSILEDRYRAQAEINSQPVLETFTGEIHMPGINDENHACVSTLKTMGNRFGMIFELGQNRFLFNDRQGNVRIFDKRNHKDFVLDGRECRQIDRPIDQSERDRNYQISTHMMLAMYPRASELNPFMQSEVLMQCQGLSAHLLGQFRNAAGAQQTVFPEYMPENSSN